MASLRNKKNLKLDCFIANISASSHRERISSPYFLNYTKTKIYDVLKATVDAADKGKLYSIGSTPEISERSFLIVLKESLHHH